MQNSNFLISSMQTMMKKSPFIPWEPELQKDSDRMQPSLKVRHSYMQFMKWKKRLKVNVDPNRCSLHNQSIYVILFRPEFRFCLSSIAKLQRSLTLKLKYLCDKACFGKKKLYIFLSKWFVYLFVWMCASKWKKWKWQKSIGHFFTCVSWINLYNWIL